MNTMAQIATSTLPAVLAISGSDSSGGAGMQADLKTMLACGVFGMSAITALTAQNTTGVRSIQDTKPDILADQINMVFEDIPPVAVKIGMVSATDIIDVIAERLTFHHATNIVLDPVMVATSGANLISDDAIAALTGKLFPMATVVTPNIPEAEVLTDTLIRDQEDMEAAAHRLVERYGCAALVKGGHGTEDANDGHSDHQFDEGEAPLWVAGVGEMHGALLVRGVHYFSWRQLGRMDCSGRRANTFFLSLLSISVLVSLPVEISIFEPFETFMRLALLSRASKRLSPLMSMI